MSFDNICKVLAEKYPTEFVNWLLGEHTEKLEILGEELIDFSAISDLFTLLEQQENS